MYRRMTPLLLLFFLLLNCWAVSSFDSIASVVENNGTLFLVTESESESNIYIVDENLNIISNVFHVNDYFSFIRANKRKLKKYINITRWELRSNNTD